MNDLIQRVRQLQQELKRDPEGTISDLREKAMDKLSEHMPSTRPEPESEESTEPVIGATSPAVKTNSKKKKTEGYESVGPEPPGFRIKITGRFIENEGGQHVFLFNSSKKGGRPNAGVVTTTIPAGSNPLAFQYEDPVEITIKKVAPEAQKTD